MTAYIDSWLFVPVQAVGSKLSALKRKLTVKPLRLRPDDPEPQPIYAYTTERAGYVGVPIDWGLHYFPTLQVDDRSSEGGVFTAPRRPDPYHPLASPNQPEFIADMHREVQSRFVALAQAGTGTGKTVSALDTAAELGRTTLILVPSSTLLSQWVQQIQIHLGVDPDDIGVICQDRCDYHKPIVVGLVHSVVGRRYDEDLYSAFGFVVWDEAHRYGAFTFSQSVGLFSAKYKLAMTATVNRKDGTDRLITYYFGDPCIVAVNATLPCKVKVLNYQNDDIHQYTVRETLIKMLTLDKSRNANILKLVSKLYDAGRVILVIGDSIKHLQVLKAGLEKMGVPSHHTCLFTGSYYPMKKNGKFESKSKTVKRADLDAMRDNQNIVVYFSTYGQFKEGTDVPRLDAGIDVTPRTEGVQVIGRIRRRKDYDIMPVWYTIRDTGSKRLTDYANARIKDYLSSENVEVEDHEY